LYISLQIHFDPTNFLILIIGIVFANMRFNKHSLQQHKFKHYNFNRKHHSHRTIEGLTVTDIKNEKNLKLKKKKSKVRRS
jgi:hypothetical protein